MAPKQHTEEESAADRRRRRAELWRLFKPYKWWFAIGAVFLVATNLLGFEIPAQLGRAIQVMRDATDPSQFEEIRAGLIDIAIIIIALAVGAGTARIFSRIFIFNAARHIEFDLRNRLYEHLTKLTPSYFGASSTGDVTSRVANDVNYVRLLYAMSFLHIINTALAYAIALEKMVALNVELTLWCLLPYPFLLVIIRFVIRALFNQTKVVQSQLSDISSKVQENLSGVEVVKTYVLEDREKEHFGEMNESFLGKNMKLVTLRGGLTTLMTMTSGVGTLIVVMVGTGMVVGDTITLGEFVEFNGYVVALAFPTTAMGWVFSVWNRGQAAFDRIMEVWEVEPDIRGAGGDAEELPPLDDEARGHIELRDVSFSYGADEPVLQNIDLDIPAGSTVAIVGKTGSGKTTLVKLLARLYDPESGEIRLDGRRLDELDLRDLRSELGFVTQEPFLFSMTVAQNIRFGIDSLEYDDTIGRDVPDSPLTRDSGKEPSRPVSQHDRLQQAVRIAGLENDIDSFSRGLDTLVGERGITLSGGQKQRVTIARALMVDPRVLILDDALSSVDTRTEKEILDHLEAIMARRTSIIITHRYNALGRVDRIFVLDEGRIVESGTHDELLEAGGLYADMYERQKLREQLDA